MFKIFWKTSLLTMAFLGLATVSHAQDAFVANAAGANPITMVPGTTANTGPNSIGVTVTEKFSVSEEHIVEYAEEFCTQIGKAEECRQAFQEYALGDGNPFDCELSPLGNQPGNGGRIFFCSKEEGEIERACAQRVGGFIISAPKAVNPDLSGRFQGVIATTEPQGPRYIAPHDLNNDSVVHRIVSSGRKVIAPVADPQELSPTEGQTAITEPVSADAPSEPNVAVEGAGCSLAPSLTGTGDPWEWVMLVLGFLPALRAWKNRD